MSSTPTDTASGGAAQKLIEEEIRIESRGLEIATRIWGDGADKQKALAVHGWLDNSASFELIAPKLAACRWQIAAPDLPGHGASNHRPLQGSYNIWDDLPDLINIADALQWEQFTIIGHSRGGMMAMLLAATLPKRIKRLILLDALAPPPYKPQEAPEQLAKFIHDYTRPRGALRLFKSVEEAAELRMKQLPMSLAIARRIVERALRPVDKAGENGFVWRNDPRVKAASAIKIDLESLYVFFRALRCPVRLLHGEQGFVMVKPENLEEIEAQIANYRRECIPQGLHHFHMQEELLDLVCERLLVALED